MSLPLGVPRRAFSYDDALEDTAPMTPPPADLCASVLWKQPVIPERKYQELSKVPARRVLGFPAALAPLSWHPPVLAPLLPSQQDPWGQSPGLALSTRGYGWDKRVLSVSSVFVVKKPSATRSN